MGKKISTAQELNATKQVLSTLREELELFKRTNSLLSDKLRVEMDLRKTAESKVQNACEASENSAQTYRWAQVKEKDSTSNPKTLTGQQKVPMLSVIPPTSLIYQAIAMRYGAFIAKKVDGTRGYGPYNWRDQPVEIETYIDAAMRHLLQFQDGDNFETIYDDDGKYVTEVPHLGFAIATLGIIADAIENDVAIDNRPKNRKRVATRLLDAFRVVF